MVITNYICYINFIYKLRSLNRAVKNDRSKMDMFKAYELAYRNGYARHDYKMTKLGHNRLPQIVTG